ncbi:hypothetical protein EJB05_14202, partial [Eragrostis curvula]
MEELVEEILLRFPPDEPACRIHTTLVCKSWYCILCEAGFLRRYRDFHGKPYLVGYIHNNSDFSSGFLPSTGFVSTCTAFTFSPSAALKRSWALNCRHGQVLVQSYDDDNSVQLIVWDPITDKQQHLPFPSYPYDYN